MKKGIVAILAVCLCLTGCGSDVPELLEPIGNNQTTVEVKRGQMYNLAVYNESVVPNVVPLRTTNSGTIQSIHCKLGDTVKAGDVLVEFGSASGEDSSENVDEEIAALNRSYEYNNRKTELDLAIAREELAMLQESGGSQEDISTKNDVLDTLQNKKTREDLDYQTELSQLQLRKSEGTSIDSQIVASVNGQVVYMNLGAVGNVVEKDVVVICIAEENTCKIFGDYIYPEEYNSADDTYALIDGARENITYDVMSDAEATGIASGGYQLFSTFLFNDENKKPAYGTYAPVVLQTDTKDDVLYIPDNALYQDVDGYYVYVPGEDDSKVRKDVEIGTQWNLYVEITNGLQEGDVVYAK